ncbi:MAG: DNA polymerase domain-containing protein, partial [Fibrobacter sp.]|nr:DNA polymerase domain-containing protein [Fibrobacter sp.]
TGQFILKKTIEHIESSTPYSVIYGDTDSLFVLLGPQKEHEAVSAGREITNDVTAWLKKWLHEEFNADSALLLQFENHFRHFLMPSIRGTTTGSKKHYCGSTIDNGNMQLHFKGMESARSDWTDLAKEVQYELITRVFTGKPIDDYLTEIVKNVKSGKCDNKLIYKKRLRKDIAEYTVNVPPHVQAARLLDNPPYLIKYVITTSGPQPIQKQTSPLDYDHYVEAQIKPVADSILELTSRSFDNIISGQQDLFS